MIAETLLAVRDLGVQINTHYANGKVSSRFISRAKIADVIINEAITMQKVVVYLAIVVLDEDRTVVVFRVCTSPKLKICSLLNPPSLANDAKVANADEGVPRCESNNVQGA